MKLTKVGEVTKSSDTNGGKFFNIEYINLELLTEGVEIYVKTKEEPSKYVSNCITTYYPEWM